MSGNTDECANNHVTIFITIALFIFIATLMFPHGSYLSCSPILVIYQQYSNAVSLSIDELLQKFARTNGRGLRLLGASNIYHLGVQRLAFCSTLHIATTITGIIHTRVITSRIQTH